MRQIRPRARVIVDNDFGGDPDGLFQLAHHALSPAVDLTMVITSKLPAAFARTDPDAIVRGVASADRALALAGHAVRARPGAEFALTAEPPPLTPAAEAIIAEARRDGLPLFYAAGGGLTDLAVALHHEPRIAERMTLVWIGGHGYGEDAAEPEFNTSTDIVAAQRVFASPIEIWQVPEPTYARCLVSWAELDADIAARSQLGALLVDTQREFAARLERMLDIDLGAVVTLGDSPLVLLTALSGPFGQPTSSRSELVVRRAVDSDGGHGAELPHLPPVRVFTDLDTRLMYGDLVATLARTAEPRRG